MEPEGHQEMNGIELLRAHLHLSDKALDIHRKWEDLDAQELLPLALELKALGLSTLASSGEGWGRRVDTVRHLGFLVTRLEQGQKELCRSDIDDLIYADLPALGSHLLRLVEVG